ncbi:cupin domain-containing protein [Vitiosangium sp. GDMCC 1.1324]|uniref:cupin domain-containing protein n=1 Tax=Vitiosangium sp. (strain GDMCC 1.1324) TaxID=2138576 RepID=UPI000D3D5C4F|nr:cupin domain-containing protein [Vitiosangium sp. GDMCC 1.1324]PTL84358.1 cupin domain-containing protein [Vitiosangium sp. GDMCC 1.1324]
MLRTSLLTAVLCVSAGCARVPTVPVRYVVNSAEAPTFRISQGKGAATLLTNEETGARAASMGVLDLQGGAGVPEHIHEHSVEMLYVEEGEAEMTIEGQTMPVKKGDAVYIPAGIRHAARIPEGTECFRAVQVYVGPGPEARFRQGEPVKPATAP